MAQLPKLHAERVAAQAAAYQQETVTLEAAHAAECAIVDNLNAEIQRRSDEEYDRLTEPLREHNAQLMAAARHQHDLALQQWQKQYQLAIMEWESMQLPTEEPLSGSKARIPKLRLSTLQPEDSAEQLSSSFLPTSQARPTAVAAPPPQPAQQDRDPLTSTAPSTASTPSQLGQAVPGHQAAAVSGPVSVKRASAMSLREPASVQSADQVGAPNSGADQPAVQMQGGRQSVDLEGAAGAESQASDAIFADVQQVSHTFSQLSSRQQSQQLQEQVQSLNLGAQQAQHDQQVQQGTGLLASQRLNSGPQQAQHDEAETPASEPDASSSSATAAGRSRPEASVYAARDLTVLEQYEADVVQAYVSSFVAEAMMQQALPAAATAVVREQHEAAVAQVQQRNADTRQQHLEEVKAERAAWEEHEANVKRWKVSKTELEAAYASELAEARTSHQQRVARLRRQWEKEQKVLQTEYKRRVDVEQAQHDVACEPIRQRNTERHEAAARRVEQRKHIEKANEDLVLAAQQLHQQRLYEAQAILSTQLVVARQQHAEVCVQLQKDHAAAQQAALQEHAMQKAVIGKWNDQATLEARGRYSAEVARLQKAHNHHSEAIQAQHNLVCQQVRQHNEAIWPQVTVATAAQQELDRVGRFIEHIRFCAEKMEIGVNFVPETPNLDRVVEMRALTEALHRAFPDLTPDQYPWPNTQGGGVDGVVRGGWPAPQRTRTSASTAQQALDKIRQAALPRSRPQSARGFDTGQQAAETAQVILDSWQATAQPLTHTSTTLAGVSYRPQTSSPSPRPSTARPATPRATHHTPKSRPATAHAKASKSSSVAVTVKSSGLLAAAAAVSGADSAQLSIAHFSHVQHQSGRRSVSPISGGSTGVTPSPAQTPCSVLSRPNTAGPRRGYQPARRAFDVAEVNSCLQRHKLAAMHSLR